MGEKCEEPINFDIGGIVGDECELMGLGCKYTVLATASAFKWNWIGWIWSQQLEIAEHIYGIPGLRLACPLCFFFLGG